jgi:aspartyl/asparaginyl beta-hydroxylase (cupin superfamily)
MAVSTKVDPVALNSAGMNALREGRYTDAAAAFRTALEGDPGATALWRNLATANRALGDTAGEMAALDAAIDIDRRDFMAWLRKAELHQRLDQEPEAFAAWQGVLQLSAQLDPIPEALVPVLDGGRAFCTASALKIEQKVTEALGDFTSQMDVPGRRRAQAFVDVALGRRKVYVNECNGLCYPFLPADEFFDEHHFPWFAELEAKTDVIRAEVKALLADPGDALRPYVRMDKGTPHSKWSPLDHSLAWGACFLWEYGRPNQAVLDRCPQTAQALAAVPQTNIPGRAPSAFFSILKPRTRIPPHTGVTNTRAIIHLPLIVPDGCGFRVGGETRAWQEGKAFAFDDTIEHEAWNDSDTMRAVLIFDVWNPHLSADEQRIIAQYFAAADASGFNVNTH